MRSSQTSVLHLAAALIVISIVVVFECHMFLRHTNTRTCALRQELSCLCFLALGWRRIVKMFLQSFLNLCQFFLEQKLSVGCLILIEVVQIQS